MLIKQVALKFGFTRMPFQGMFQSSGHAASPGNVTDAFFLKNSFGVFSGRTQRRDKTRTVAHVKFEFHTQQYLFEINKNGILLQRQK
jgi:hypothetical protein